MLPFIFLLNIYPTVYLGEINCLVPPIAELLRWEPGIVFKRQQFWAVAVSRSV